MKILLIYPEVPTTFWSLRHALRFISKKSSEPPLGLLTVAAMLPGEWEKKLIDMNVSPLTDDQISWADYVFLSGMNVHTESIREIIRRCNKLGVKIVAGGPLFTFDYKEFSGIDHFILNEAEITLPMFLKDLQDGCPKQIYSSDIFPDISQTPIPRWDLLEIKKYSTMSVQYSRGCPYNCDFCSITMLNGRKPRTKSKDQFLAELDTLYKIGWRDTVFVVDDNFIGKKTKLKKEILPVLIEWNEKRNHPFSYLTEVSINLADDEELVKLMVEAGFYSVFVGIETTHERSLEECGKINNLKRDILASVKKLHQQGLVVAGGFIIGFDNDPPNIFEQQINFIQQSGIVTAMVGLLNAPSGTHLFQRLKQENRLLKISSGDNMDGSMNFIPKMNYAELKKGYKKVLRTIYSQKEYYKRIKSFLKEYNPPTIKPIRINIQAIQAFIKSLWILGILEKGKRFYWKLLFISLFKEQKKFPIIITMAIYGFHFRQVVGSIASD